MKFKKASVKLLSVFMALTMLFSVCSTAVWAISDEVKSGKTAGKGELNYVSIGDSMTNGYGFDGYEQGEISAEQFFKGEGVYGKGSYALQFADYLENKGYSVTHTKLASSAMRAEDLLYLLGGREKPTDGWFEQVNLYTGVKDNEALSAYYIEAVKNADIITLCIGNASFGAYMVQYLTRALGVMGVELDEDEVVDLEMALELLESEEAKELVLEVYDLAMNELIAYIPESIKETYPLEVVADALAYIVAGFLLNYEGVIDAVAELNPDCEVILIGLMNTTYGMEITAEGLEESIKIGDIMDELFGFLNAYIAGIPAAKQLASMIPSEVETNEEIEAMANKFGGMAFYYAEQPNPEFIVQAFDDLKANNWENVDDGRLSGEIVRQRTIDAFHEILTEIRSMPGMENLPDITLEDIKAFETAEWTDTGYDWMILCPDKSVSVAIYLAIEDALVASVDTMEIPVTGLISF